MIYIGFSPMYSFEETLKLYEELKNSVNPWVFLDFLDQKGILMKNGTREKIYLEKGKRREKTKKNIYLIYYHFI